MTIYTKFAILGLITYWIGTISGDNDYTTAKMSTLMINIGSYILYMTASAYILMDIANALIISSSRGLKKIKDAFYDGLNGK